MLLNLTGTKIFTRIFYLLPLLFLLGCVEGSMYEKNISVDPNGWAINDSVKFEVEINDTITPMNFLLTLRHNGEYQYSNIYFFVNTVYPTQDYSRDTIEILLAGKDGSWFGSGFGELKEVQIMLKDRVVFPMKGLYTFSFVQAMRDDPLPGIEDMGIRIEKAQPLRGK